MILFCCSFWENMIKIHPDVRSRKSLEAKIDREAIISDPSLRGEKKNIAEDIGKFFPRMRSEGFLFLIGGSGDGIAFVSILEMISHTPAHDRARSRTFAV